MLSSAELQPPSWTAWPRALLELAFQSGLASALFVCGFQPLLALLLTGRVDAIASAAMLVLVWQLYLLDRLRENPEDALDELHPASFTRTFRAPLLASFAALALLEAWLVWLSPGIARSILISLVLSMFYLVRLPPLGKRVKEVPYLKCFYLALVSLGMVTAFSAGWSEAEPALIVKALGVSFLLYFLNFSLYDAKDIDNDRRASLKTLAGAVPLPLFLRLHCAGALSAALLALLLPITYAAVLAAVASFHGVMSAWLMRRPFSPALCGWIDMGYGLILGTGALWLAAR